MRRAPLLPALLIWFFVTGCSDPDSPESQVRKTLAEWKKPPRRAT